MYPQLSAYALLNSNFNSSKTPLPPPGTRVVIFDGPQNRSTESPHGTLAWYMGPTMRHYQCFNFYAPFTAATRINATVKQVSSKMKNTETNARTCSNTGG